MKIKLSIERELSEISSVGLCVRQLCEHHHNTGPIQMELMIAELLTNIVKHSIPDDNNLCEFPVALTLVITDKLIMLSVSEVGRPTSPEVVDQYTLAEVAMPAVDGDLMDLPESGWGVQLIKSYCDDISYERVGDSNVFHLCFDPNALAA